ncbi:hypothetical protein F511_06138 [Dorcoceras hygrometricum]|uniref:Mucin-2-like n=1 Tax=Dorcoceras hygrometricum TaxID=472368 RepID=A0A2Z7AHR5_9LAMI|nr:hypothetical protein F511_06138 [Dorcoceras hygrometricum]
MASSLFVNTLQVNFTSVLTMEHAGMVRMFKTLEDTGLCGFLEGTTPIFESAVVEFFSNARVIAGTVVSTVFGEKLVVTEDIFSKTFKLPTEGMHNFSDIPTETIAEMRTRFSATTVPFQSSGKKKDLLFEYRLLHDIVAKSLCAKAGSFDKVTCEKFEAMVAISPCVTVNWGRFYFNGCLLWSRIQENNPMNSAVQVSILMELLVRADLERTTKLHIKKVLTSKKVQNYLMTNQGPTPTEETASTLRVERPNKYRQNSQSRWMIQPNTMSLIQGRENTRLRSRRHTHNLLPQKPLLPRKILRIKTLWFHRLLILRRIQRRIHVRWYITNVKISKYQNPLIHSRSHLKRLRTQKQADPIHPDPTQAITTEELSEEEIIQEGGVDNFTENLDLHDQKVPDEHNDRNINIDHQTVSED